MDIVILIFGVVLIVICVFIALAWEKRRSGQIVNQWAEQNGFKLNESEFRALKRGPFWATTWNYQAVRKLVVTGTDGNPKTGWVRCNAYLPTGKVEVRWD